MVSAITREPDLGTRQNLAILDVKINDPVCSRMQSRGDSRIQQPTHGGAQFLFADGAVRFLSENIEFQNNNPNQQSPVNPIGTFQKLGRRNDGFVIGEF